MNIAIAALSVCATVILVDEKPIPHGCGLANAKLMEHLKKVHALMVLGLIAAYFGAEAALLGFISPGILMVVAQLVISGVLVSTYKGGTRISNGGIVRSGIDNGTSKGRIGLMLSWAFCAGVNVSAWLRVGLIEAGLCHPDRACIWGNAELIAEAFIVSSSIYAVFMLVALFWNPRHSLFAYAISCVAACGFWIQFGFMFIPRSWVSYELFQMVYVKIPLLTFSFKIVHDTWCIADRVQRGIYDVASDAAESLANFLNLFVRVFHLLAQLEAQKRERENRRAKKEARR